MTLQQIYYFLCAAKHNSFSKAAMELYITQPALTKAIHELENELSVTLFSRSCKGAFLTAQGEEFLYRARDLYNRYEQLMNCYKDPDERLQFFGVSCQHYSFAVQAFINLVRQKGTGKYQFAIRETTTRSVIQDVCTSRSEIGILYLSSFNSSVLKKLFMENKLEFNELVKCSAYIYISEDHPLASRSSVAFEDLKDYPCLSFEQTDASSYYFMEELYPTLSVSQKIFVNDRAGMLNLMDGLNGYTICSGIIFDDLNGQGYTAVPIRTECEEYMRIGYLCKKKGTLSNLALDYIEEVRKVLKTGSDILNSRKNS